jgi:hypothetical protein
MGHTYVWGNIIFSTAACHWQTLSHNVVSSTLRLSKIRTHNISGDKHRLHRQLIQRSFTTSTCKKYVTPTDYCKKKGGPSWSWSYGSWIYNCLCNRCLSPLMLWVRILLRRSVLDTTLCDKVCQWHAAVLVEILDELWLLKSGFWLIYDYSSPILSLSNKFLE